MSVPVSVVDKVCCNGEGCGAEVLCVELKRSGGERVYIFKKCDGENFRRKQEN